MSAHIQADIDRPAEGPLGEMRVIERNMCACTDAVCAGRVNAEMEQLLQRHADTKAIESQIKEAGAIMGRIVECQVRAVGRRP